MMRDHARTGSLHSGTHPAFQPRLARGDDDSETAVRAVRAVLDQQVRDWNKGDLDGFLTGYWNSPKVVFMSGGNRFDGFEAMRDRYRRRYKAEGKAMGELAFADLDVEPLGPDWAVAPGRFRLSMPDGTKPTGLFTVIVRKFPEETAGKSCTTTPRPKRRRLPPGPRARESTFAATKAVESLGARGKVFVPRSSGRPPGHARRLALPRPPGVA